VAALGGILGAAGIGAVGTGTYLKVKSSLDTGSAVGAAIGASLAAAGAGYLAAVGTAAVWGRLMHASGLGSESLNPRAMWTLGFAKKKAGATAEMRGATYEDLMRMEPLRNSGSAHVPSVKAPAARASSSSLDAISVKNSVHEPLPLSQHATVRQPAVDLDDLTSHHSIVPDMLDEIGLRNFIRSQFK